MRKKFTLLITVTALLLGSSGGKVCGQSMAGGTPPYFPNYNGNAMDGNVTTNNIYIVGGRDSYSHDPYNGASGCHDTGSPAYSIVGSATYYQWINVASVTVDVLSGQREYNRFMFGNMSLATVQQNRYSTTHNHSCSGNCGSGGTWCSSCCSCGPYTYYVWPTTYVIAQNTARPANIVIHGGARIHLTNTGSSIDRDKDSPTINAYNTNGTSGAALTHTGTTTITFPALATDHFTLRMDGTFEAGQDGVISLANAGTLHSGDTLGVNGNYNHSQAWTTFSGQVGGTFQIGASTTNTNKFTILSGGTLMNYGANNVNIGNGASLIPIMTINGGTAACNNLTNALIIRNTQQSIIYNNSTLAPQVTFSAGGPLWMTAAQSVEYCNGATFNVNTNSNYIQVNAGSNIATTGAFAYTGGTSNYRFVAGNNFTVSGTTTITTNDDCGIDLIQAGQNISFGDNVLVNKNKDGENTMHAVNGYFAVADGKTYTFKQNNGANTNKYVMVRAGTNITMGGTVLVERAATTVGDIDWTADAGNIWTKQNVTFTNKTASGATRWTAGTNIQTDKDVVFTHSGTGTTTWYAAHNITSTNCPDNIDFIHTGTGDVEWWANTGSISVKPNILFTKTNADNGHTLWHAGVDINTDNNVTFTSASNIHTTSTSGVKWNAIQNINVKDICAPGATTIAFTNNSTYDDYMWWNAGRNINVDGSSSAQRITVNFLNKAANQDNSATNYMKWQAGTNVDIDFANITFTTDAGSSGYTEWYAGTSILMDNSKVDFINQGTGLNDNTKWHAVSGDIDAGNTPITYTNTGIGWTHWQAGHDILLHHQSPVLFDNAVTTNWLKLQAYRDLRTGINSPMLIDHKSPNLTSLPANITLEATTRNIWTESSVDILNAGIQNQTYLYAGQDIRIDSTFTFTATNVDGIDWVRMRANAGDIIVNTQPSDIQHPDPAGFNASNTVCDTRRAAVNFTLLGTTNAGSTEWWAGKNIITNDTVHFHYDNTDKTVGNLLLHADEENIDLRRIMKIDYDSDNLIRMEALTNASPRSNKHSIFGVAPCYSGREATTGWGIGQYGNIRTSDSLIINRINRTNTAAGLTELEAYNDIQTAMVNFTSENTFGDNTNVTSKMGDIWLGYSWKNPVECGTNNIQSPVSYDLNRFVYRVPVTTGGKLNIKAGYDDSDADKYGGGNIYFTHIVDSFGRGGTYDTEISIPYSNMFSCNANPGVGIPYLGGCDYERAGIIGGVWRCQITATSPVKCDTIGFTHVGNNGRLLVDAGTRGNIIFNNGAFLNFQEGVGNTEFRTRWGDIDMRYPFDADSLQGSLLFLASSDLPGKLNTGLCTCDEMKNNVYLQDFEYSPIVNSGSVFVGADNNIKLQYGGLKNINTTRDPFWSGNVGYPCGSTFHCDADTAENKARDLILNFYQDGSGAAIAKGGFAAVASDRIDTYKNMIYNGGSGSGLSSVPAYGSLHGESVAGYGLYIKTQGNKKNWTMTDHDVNNTPNPWIGAACVDEACSYDFLHNIARVTFHADARIYAENQRVLISSPVLETFGNADYNTDLRKGSKTSILLQADSLIYHDSLIIDGPKTQFTTWSGLYRDMPVIKLGHHRFTPPAAEDGGSCAPCFTHPKDPRSAGTKALDTVFVTFRNDASVQRLHTLVAEHAVISFLTDSFDHAKGNPTLNAKFYTDTFKIRNHVELFKTPDHTHDGHFELISEEQMASKDYAGIYSRHLHMEPISPSCSNFAFSQLWLQDPALDVITSSTFGGFGWLHADVHVENQANLFPGFASLGTDGNCYEQRAGVLKMQDLRMDVGANFKVTIGEADAANSFAEMYECPMTFESVELGRYADCLSVDSLSIYGTLKIDIDVRSALDLEAGESRCYPIIQYQSVGKDNLNNLQLSKLQLTSDDHKSIDGTYYLTLDIDTVCNVVYLCIATIPDPVLLREVHIPSVSGITTDPVPGNHYVRSGGNFNFTAKYGSEHIKEGEQLAVRTGRIINGENEIIVGIKNANGEYEYLIREVRTNLRLTFGPDYVSADDIEGALVWSHNQRIFIRVDQKDVASIYLVTGQLVKQIEVPEGTTSVAMEYGVYIVTLKDGSVHKVIIK